MGTRLTGNGTDRVYRAAEAWTNAALRNDGSLFVPASTVWSSPWLRKLRERFLDQPDISGNDFLEKLQGQLDGAEAEVHQLMAEALYFHLLIVSTKNDGNKRRNIERVLRRSPSPVEITPKLVGGLTPGIVNPGTFFNIRKDIQIGFIIEFVEQWKQLEPNEQERLLRDAWAFKSFAKERKFQSRTLMDATENSYRTQMEALLHLMFPDVFEAIVSSNHKQLIAQTFADFVDDPVDDVDRHLEQIRPKIESRFGSYDHIYYQPNVRALWREGTRFDPLDDLPESPGHAEGLIVPGGPVSLEMLAQEMLWESDQLHMVIQGLEDKGQAIFQGPPGTGKTFVARRIAQWYQQQGGDFRIVQFHPSYSYEDFVEGYRPVRNPDGQVGYDLLPGPLRLMAEQAREKPDAKFILVIDEINRGEVAKILGELYFLLEYRDEGVDLQYSHDSFQLPMNLWFIGTMNTTDRSIALVDAALRRRFYFFGFYPDEPPVQGMLRRWLRENNREALWVADLVDAANRKLSDRHLGIGPSHFMKKDPPLDEARVRFIWDQAVMPYIEEQCFGEEDRLREFAYDRLMAEVNSGNAASDSAQTGGPDTDVVGQPEDDGDDPAS